MRMSGLLGAAVLSVLATAAAMPAPAFAAKEPPSCAAIRFRPLAAGMQDGEQDAGLYKSRFGKLEVRGTVKGGEPQDYYVVANGKKLAPVAGGVPKSAASCAQQKKMPAPASQTVSSCTGDAFTVVIDRAGNQRTALFYGHQNGAWKFCSAGAVPSRES
jgi:hypothetical protein